MDNNLSVENGRTSQIIEKLVDMIENGQSVPLSTGKVAVNKDEAILMLKELENIVNGELKVYREVNDKKGRIITDAKKEAEDIINQAEQSASRIRVTKKLSSGSTLKSAGLAKEDKMALRTAHDIYAASLIYTDEMLTEVNDIVAQAYDLIENQYGKMVEVLEEKAAIIAQNKAELMGNLKELSKEERYEQILELSQLLSNELYNERQKATNMQELAIEKRKLAEKEDVSAEENKEIEPAIKDENDNAPEKDSLKEDKKETKEKENIGDSSLEEVAVTENPFKIIKQQKPEDKKQAVANSINMFKSYIPKE